MPDDYHMSLTNLCLFITMLLPHQQTSLLFTATTTTTTITFIIYIYQYSIPIFSISLSPAEFHTFSSKRMAMSCELRGKVVMVTGASSGLGKEFSLDLARAGCKIIAAARRVDRLKTLCSEINQPGFTGAETVRAVAVELDVTANGPTIEAAVNKAWDAFGHIDCLINNAGIIGHVKNHLDLTEEEWNSVFATNLTGAWLVSKSVCTRMRNAKLGGSVINIGSIAGLNRGFLPGSLAYCSSKAALNTMTKVMAMELGVHNIRVNCINPGIFKSEITEGLLKKNWISRVVEKSVPLKTYGESDPALTSVIRYLIHDSSRYVSGNSYIVDAGATLPGLPLFSSL